jgi:alcohol dehydrogenase
LIAINTTAGTASEMTRFCIITDESRHIKMAIVDRNVTPILSVNDPELMLAKPKGLTAATGMDALTRAVEAYVSIAATPITDACAFKAVELIALHLRSAVAHGDNLQAREQMAYAQFLAGMAFNNDWAMCTPWRTNWVVLRPATRCLQCAATAPCGSV